MNLSIDVIRKLLPHRYPFLLLDKVIKLDPGKSAVGIKNVTINEPYFSGHFPTQPIVPGVLIIESLAQLAAVMYCSEFFPADTDWDNLDGGSINEEEIASKVGYLVDIKNVKFKKIVRPGDTLELKVFKKAQFGLMSQLKVQALVDGEGVVEGVISVSQRP